MKYPFETEIKIAAQKHGLNADLVAAFCFVESSFDPEALRYEPKFQSKYIDRHPRYCIYSDHTRALLASSLGLMQIMGLTAVELGLNILDCDSLYEPRIGLEYGCKYLAKLIKKYSPHPSSLTPHASEAVIAAYNAGSPRKGPKGNWVNYKYVNKVVKKFQEYQKMG